MFSTGIYIIISPTNKIYVGQSRNLSKRRSAYKKGKCSQQPKIYASINKYGWDSHRFEVIMSLKSDIDQGMLDMWEQFFIDHYRDSGYTLLNLKEGGYRGQWNPESIEKMKTSLSKIKRKPHSASTRMKLSIAKKGNTTTKGRKLPDWQKAALLEANKGKKHSVEHVAKRAISISGENSGNVKLNNLQVRVIIHSLNFGVPIRYLSNLFKVNYNTIHYIKFGKAWSHVTGIYHPSKKHVVPQINLTHQSL